MGRRRKKWLHGMTYTPEFNIWTSMKMRCENPNHHAYASYGGRGIKVCERWRHFENFLADMGHRPHPYYTIERLDNDGGYEKENCKWASYTEQANNRRTNRIIEVYGQKMTIAQAVKKYAVVSDSSVRQRIDLGWTPEGALTIPRQTKGGRKFSMEKKHGWIDWPISD